MDIQIKNLDAVIEASEEIQRLLHYHYGEMCGYGEGDGAYAGWGLPFVQWQSNAADKQIIDEKFKKLNLNSGKLYRAMEEINNAILTYATNLKNLSSTRID